jgi:hypothetical protein
MQHINHKPFKTLHNMDHYLIKPQTLLQPLLDGILNNGQNMSHDGSPIWIKTNETETFLQTDGTQIIGVILEINTRISNNMHLDEFDADFDKGYNLMKTQVTEFSHKIKTFCSDPISKAQPDELILSNEECHDPIIIHFPGFHLSLVETDLTLIINLIIYEA